ncbi:MAG: hypothetical protein IH621_13155 [Krumholzibacteria bacterium]|nr:hypothetical protein [Candidatus Krumholzibacteria bacterium]
MRTMILLGCLAALLAPSLPAAAETVFDQPLLLTAAGGSVDINLAGVLLKRQGVAYTANATAAPGDLEGVKTLVVVPGYSSKGLGAAGVSREQEMERITGLIKTAKERGIPVLTLHLGGNARRGAQSDDFNRIAAEAADLLIVVAQGDEDGFFTAISKEAGIPMRTVDSMSGAAEPLGEVITK